MLAEALEAALAAAATLSKAVLGVMAAITMATSPMEETSTQATSAVTVAMLQATMAMVAMEALLLVVSVFSLQKYSWCVLRLAERHDPVTLDC